MNLSSLSYYLLPNSADGSSAVHSVVHTPSIVPSLSGGIISRGAVTNATLNSPRVTSPSCGSGVGGIGGHQQSIPVGGLASTAGTTVAAAGNNIINFNPKLIAPAAAAVISLPITPVEQQNCSSLIPSNATAVTSIAVNKRVRL